MGKLLKQSYLDDPCLYISNTAWASAHRWLAWKFPCWPSNRKPTT